MPAKLVNQQFPIVYGPWYVYEVALKPTRKVYKYDIIIPTSGAGADNSVFVHPNANPAQDVQLENGYLISLDTVEAGSADVKIQAAVPGTVIPAVAGDETGGLAPGMPVKAHYLDANTGIVMLKAESADIVAHRMIGRMRTVGLTTNNLEKTSANGKDIIMVHTGVM